MSEGSSLPRRSWGLGTCEGQRFLLLTRQRAVPLAGQPEGVAVTPEDVPTICPTTNQSVYQVGDRMVVTVTTSPSSSTVPRFVLVALVTPINTDADPFFIYRFDPNVELITFEEALSRIENQGFAAIAGRPLQVVTTESIKIFDLTLPALPLGSYQWLAALFSEDLSTSSGAAAPFTFQ